MGIIFFNRTTITVLAQGFDPKYSFCGQCAIHTSVTVDGGFSNSGPSLKTPPKRWLFSTLSKKIMGFQLFNLELVRKNGILNHHQYVFFKKKGGNKNNTTYWTYGVC